MVIKIDFEELWLLQNTSDFKLLLRHQKNNIDPLFYPLEMIRGTKYVVKILIQFQVIANCDPCTTPLFTPFYASPSSTCSSIMYSWSSWSAWLSRMDCLTLSVWELFSPNRGSRYISSSSKYLKNNNINLETNVNGYQYIFNGLGMSRKYFIFVS